MVPLGNKDSRMCMMWPQLTHGSLHLSVSFMCLPYKNDLKLLEPSVLLSNASLTLVL